MSAPAEELRTRDIPPLAEVGAPGFDWAAWQAVAVPAGVQQDIRGKLNAAFHAAVVEPDAAFHAAVGEPDVQKQLVNLQFIPIGKGSPDELDRFVSTETVRWAKVLQQAGVAGTQ
jgi:tripartite-type tricarboxylate transporter receptor subunit TctC